MRDGAGDGWIEVREPHTEKLLFRYDPERHLVEIVRRGVATVVDLTRYVRAEEEKENELESDGFQDSGVG